MKAHPSLTRRALRKWAVPATFSILAFLFPARSTATPARSTATPARSTATPARSIAADCGELKVRVSRALTHNECQTLTDCRQVNLSAPFGCGLAISKQYAVDAEQLDELGPTEPQDLNSGEWSWQRGLGFPHYWSGN